MAVYSDDIANTTFRAKKQTNPDMTKAEEKKIKQQALAAARVQVGAKRHNIPISDRQWEAIQAGAISESQLMQIINHVDSDTLRQRATPRAHTIMSDAKISKIQAMKASGYTNAEIATALNVSASTVGKYL